jgi:plasmid stability protein
MPVNLSIKNVPDKLVKRLRKRAEINHRSVQGELLKILEETLIAEKKRLTIEEISKRVRALGLQTLDEGTAMIRADRDAR